jgi:hypothetical protein
MHVKTSWALAAIAVFVGCGASVVKDRNSGVDPRAEPTVGVGPVDASGEPAALVTTCDGAVSGVSMKLPCLLGGDLGGGTSELECQLSSAPDGSPTDVAINMMFPLTQLPALLNQLVSLPFDGPAPPPVEGGGEISAFPGERFSGSLAGTATFSEVDPIGRAFIGRIEQATVTWTGDRGDALSCSVVDGPFWAVAGGFY